MNQSLNYLEFLIVQRRNLDGFVQEQAMIEKACFMDTSCQTTHWSEGGLAIFLMQDLPLSANLPASLNLVVRHLNF
jgi:hypothetical protein